MSNKGWAKHQYYKLKKDNDRWISWLFEFYAYIETKEKLSPIDAIEKYEHYDDIIRKYYYCEGKSFEETYKGIQSEL